MAGAHSAGGSMANVLRTPKSKERFGGGCSVDEPSPFNLSRICSAEEEGGEKQRGKQGTYEAFFDVGLRPQLQAFHGDLGLSVRASLWMVRVTPSLFCRQNIAYNNYQDDNDAPEHLPPLFPH
jgi:hypothetical protein